MKRTPSGKNVSKRIIKWDYKFLLIFSSLEINTISPLLEDSLLKHLKRAPLGLRGEGAIKSIILITLSKDISHDWWRLNSEQSVLRCKVEGEAREVYKKIVVTELSIDISQDECQQNTDKCPLLQLHLLRPLGIHMHPLF